MKFEKKTKIKILGSISLVLIIGVTITIIATVTLKSEEEKINKSEEREEREEKIIKSEEREKREAILISGGINKNGPLSAVELFLPKTNQSCSLPPMTRSRSLHSQNQFLACGGGGTSGSSCEEFNPNLGHWGLRASPLIRNRRRHSSWTLNNGSVLLLGGIQSTKENIAELVSPGLKSVRSALLNENMLYDSCAVEDSRHQHLYLIGGGGFLDYSRVRRYPDQVNFPQLSRGRFGHACAGYYSDQDQLVLLVAGGKDKNSSPFSLVGFLSSTEIYQVGSEKGWTEVTGMPNPTTNVRAVSVNNKIYLLGGETGETRKTYEETIYVFEEEKWKQVASMKVPRANHGVSGISLLQENIDKYCI